jgi:hypothetical protein
MRVWYLHTSTYIYLKSIDRIERVQKAREREREERTRSGRINGQIKYVNICVRWNSVAVFVVDNLGINKKKREKKITEYIAYTQIASKLSTTK